MKGIDLQPLITETSLKNAKKNWWTFRAPVGENKDSLRKLIEKVFKIGALEVKTAIVKGKSKRSPRSRKVCQGSDWKKVMVKTKEGQKIDIFDQV